MLDFLCSTIMWCFFIYGAICLIESIFQDYTYNKIKKNVKLILTVKDAENGIENYIKELKFGKNFYNNLVVIDLGSKDNTLEILKDLEKETINLKILNEKEGKKYLENLNIS
jgi:flagellar biosynthesis regulator FlaF